MNGGETKSCSSGFTCQDGDCKSSCTDECSWNEKECVGSGFKKCDNYDSDPCSEWGEVTRCPSGYECKDGACSVNPSQQISCNDPDGGLNYNEATTVTLNDGTSKSDYCAENMVNTLYEMFCYTASDGTSSINEDPHYCPSGCSSGKCL